MATSSQIKRIHILKGLLGIDDETYIEMLHSFDATTSKQLTFDEAKIILGKLEDDAVALNLWKKIPLKYEDLNRDSDRATPAQLRMIKGIWREIVYLDTDKFANKSLHKFLEEKHKINDIMFLTKAKASKVIQSILKMRRNLEKGTAAL